MQKRNILRKNLWIMELSVVSALEQLSLREVLIGMRERGNDKEYTYVR